MGAIKSVLNQTSTSLVSTLLEGVRSVPEDPSDPFRRKSAPVELTTSTNLNPVNLMDSGSVELHWTKLMSASRAAGTLQFN
jgi:hypothetical protein